MPDEPIYKSMEQFIIRRKFNFKARHKNQHYKIRINKPRPRTSLKEKLLLLALSLGIVGLIIMAVTNTKVYKLFVLARSIQNERILIGFQNSAELRPTGGFWGSFAILDVKNNLLDSQILFETNPYKNSNPTLAEIPKELPKPIAETWPDSPIGFVNANWSPDFTEAAKTLEWHFGLGWDEHVDGVVGISSLSIIDLLKLTGPITISDGTVVSSDNFTQIMSQKIDTEYWQNPENIKTNEPKTILKELAPKVIDKTKNISKLALVRFLSAQMDQGRVLAYFNDANNENLVQDMNISGNLQTYSQDYLAIINANLNGGKSSLNINQKIDYSITTEKDNSISNLTITRYLNDDWPDILNRNYTRVFVPLGSKLQSATLDGNDITKEVETLEESGRTSFGFWFSVSPKQQISVNLKYVLPFNLSSGADYSLIYQKQPGTKPENVSVSLDSKKLFDEKFDKSAVEVRN